jgi:hypothetical protein
VRHHRMDSRPHVQGSAAPLRLRHSAAELTDGAGLVLLRRTWDALGIGAWLDGHGEDLRGEYRPPPDGRALGGALALWRRLHGRPGMAAPPGDPPPLRLEGRARSDPLRPLAFAAETGDCLGVVWRAGNAPTAEGACPWIRTLVGRLRAAGVEEITLRLDKGFFSREMVRALHELEVSFYLKVPHFRWVRSQLGPARRSKKDAALWTRSGSLYGARLLSVEHRKAVEDPEALELECWEVTKRAPVLTNVEGVHALTAWRAYNAGAGVEDRIKEMGELGVGRTAVDDLGGNALLWSLGALAYELLHWIRTAALSGSWKRAQPKRLRAWLFRLPAKLTTHARKGYLQLRREEPLKSVLLEALRRLERLRAPPLPA